MNRAERRARERWKRSEPQTPLDAALAQIGAFVEANARFAAVTRLAELHMEAQGGKSPAQAEALDRWAIPAASAFKRATADMDRLRRQLAGIACLDSEG